MTNLDLRVQGLLTMVADRKFIVIDGSECENFFNRYPVHEAIRTRLLEETPEAGDRLRFNLTTKGWEAAGLPPNLSVIQRIKSWFAQ
ncbi:MULTISPECIES: hypothetical protein [unclassified Rhizobium]|uniref:hypothetical protein n=1 Tax=unclassified Rhizobium TaxID=2613769 RepID=UPI000715866C|nr:MULTISPECIES: hypothetical protein [unclassified Rhizobium]KQT04708.1 hypothetical protein ASG50_15685 [Rhizobium sp. Leaf386]KQT05073.1 hypothetical protein ASG42_21335 [Rhizobium sp. Leaf391]KQU00982.1 hypothetical protein ASG68_29310 [Rhizobium sp. Leaf453]